MIRKGILITLIATMAQSNQVITIKASHSYQRALKAINNKGIDVLGVDYRNKLIDINTTLKEFNELELGLDYKISKENKLQNKIDERYLNSVEIEKLLKDIHKKYPKITKLIKVGETYESQDIWALKVSDNAKVDETNEPAILFNGMHHSREIMTAEVVSDIAVYLVENYQSNSKVKNWVDNSEIYILPILNVDGNIKVWNGSKMWRKNTRGGYGVDINRNYPTNWNSCRGSSGWRNSQTYRGPEAASEPETQVLMNFVSAIKPVFNISYHAYSELVIYPFGCKGQRTTNVKIVEGIGKEMARRLDYVPGTAWETLYSVDGSDIDWMYQEEQVIPYVIEVSPRSDGFAPNYDKRDPTVKRNRVGWQYLLDRIHGPALSGVTSKDFSQVKIFNTKDELEQDYRINPDGSFHIILNPGKYIVQFHGQRIETRHVTIGEKNLVLKI